MDLQKAEELAKLGQFAGIFSVEDETERKQRIKRFIAGLESQARKLENFEPRGRVSALRILAIQLQQYISDYEALNDAQKKEVQPLMDKINERMTEIQAIINKPR